MTLLAVFTTIVLSFSHAVDAAPLFPALYVFGDSTVDSGNNDYVETIVKANFPPYGRDFDSRKATGRFSNGRVASDYIALSLGLPFPPTYLDPSATGRRIIRGVNFATAGSGLYEKTTALLNVPNLLKQLSWFRSHKQALIRQVGPTKAADILSKALFVLSTGSNDFINNYNLDPILQKTYTPKAFSGVLISRFESFVKELYRLGARKISVPGLIPLGCIPSQVTIYSAGQLKCAEFENQQARLFNQALIASVKSLNSEMKALRVAYTDTYTAFDNVMKNPSKYGFQHTLTSCCGFGRLEASILCNSFTPGTCHDASKYVFWDSFHPSDAMNKILAQRSLQQALPQLFRKL